MNILIVDDHAIVRQGLRMMLEAQPHLRVVGEAANSQDAVRLARELSPDVVLMDLLMPGMSAIEGIRQLANDGVKVLILSSSVQDGLVGEALAAGAQGYVLKASRPADLLYAIEQVTRGLNPLDSGVSHLLMRRLQSDDPLLTLTSREREVFDLMARALSNAQMADKLVVSEGTVRTHVASVLDKLQLRDRAQVTIYALKRGLVQLDDVS